MGSLQRLLCALVDSSVGHQQRQHVEAECERNHEIGDRARNAPSAEMLRKKLRPIIERTLVL